MITGIPTYLGRNQVLPCHDLKLDTFYLFLLSTSYACRIIICVNLVGHFSFPITIYVCLQTEECLKTISYPPLENMMVAYALRRKLWLAAFKLMQHCRHNLLYMLYGWKLLTNGIHDENSVTERVSMSVQMLLPVKMNT